MKKISILFLSIILMLFAIVNPVMAAEATTSISLSNTEVKQEETVTVTFNINNLTVAGSKALSGKIQFDKDVLEFVEGGFSGNWDGAISNDHTGFSAYTSKTESINQVLTLKFKVKSAAKAGNTTISISNVRLALEEGNGETENEISVSGSSASLKVISTTQENQNTNQSKDPTTSTSTSHPKTGLESTMLTVGMITLIIFSVVFYGKYKNINNI